MTSHAAASEKGDTCTWTEDCGPYSTSCGNYFEIIDGTPAENGMLFCPYCGRRIEDVPLEEAAP